MEAYIPEYKKIWSQKIINSEDYDEEHQNQQTQMPFSTTAIYGDVRIGDYTLAHGQMDEILEPEPIIPLQKEQLVKVLGQDNTSQHNYLFIGGLSDFKLICIAGES